MADSKQVIQRDETQDMWVFEDGGDCLGVVEYEGRINDDGEVLFEEGDRYVRFVDLDDAQKLLQLADAALEALRDYVEFLRPGAECRECAAASQVAAFDAYQKAKDNHVER